MTERDSDAGQKHVATVAEIVWQFHKLRRQVIDTLMIEANSPNYDRGKQPNEILKISGCGDPDASTDEEVSDEEVSDEEASDEEVSEEEVSEEEVPDEEVSEEEVSDEEVIDGGRVPASNADMVLERMAAMFL
jgi:hypothetical protein